MMSRDLELRLLGSPTPDGEIAVRDLAALSTALQELFVRIGRDVIQTPGPGRTRQFMEEFAQLRLRDVAAGSTRLEFSRGPAERLDVDLPVFQDADDRFWAMIHAIRDDHRPDWVTDLVAESAAKFVSAVRAAAPRTQLSDSTHAAVEIESSRVRVETWTPTRVPTGDQMQARGRLEKVDLHSHEFRVRDDIDQAVNLKHVASDGVAASYVGQWVVATGDGVVVSDRLVALDNARIELLDDPARGLEGEDPMSLEDLLASAPGPDADGGIDMDDEEFGAFIEAARA